MEDGDEGDHFFHFKSQVNRGAVALCDARIYEDYFVGRLCMKRIGLICFMVALSACLYAQIGTDVTNKGDPVIGVPNDNDWPPSENPNMAINNDSSTKYLHFKGELMPTGFRVTPSKQQTIVGGMTFTTANDQEGRDPMTFQLWGSNVSINGPYILIASGDTYLPVTRFAMNTSPIAFHPGGAYDHYQVLFPTIRGADMMQIGEVELLGGYLPIYSPLPRDAFENIPTNTTISWQVAPDIINPMFTVFFGTDPNVTHNDFVTNVTAKELDPATILGEPLKFDTQYYWSVEIVGDPNTWHTWKFKTAPAVPVVVQEPDDVVSEAGASAVFRLDAQVIGDPQQELDFQWYFEPTGLPVVTLADGDGISGALTDTLTLTNLEAADVGKYYCIATGDAGSVESRHASLQLLELLGHWPLDGDCTDISGYDNHGIARGAAFGFDEGMIGQAANFDNLGLFEIPNPSHFDQANSSITVYCWVKTGGTGDNEPFVARYGENDQGWQFQKLGVSAVSSFTLRGTTGDDSPGPNSPTIFDNQWHQLIGTYDGTTRRIFMDGNQVLSLADTGNIASTTVPVSIGGRITDGTPREGWFFNGMVDDVRIYKGAMPIRMVQKLYTEASGVEFCSTPIPGDVSGPIDQPDCVLDLYDLASFASNWLNCTNIDPTRCP